LRAAGSGQLVAKGTVTQNAYCDAEAGRVNL
jgi:hypothetical protein